MIAGATAPAISNVFVNNGAETCAFQISGSYTTATVMVEGLVNIESNAWDSIAIFDLSNFELEDEGADGNGIYQIPVEGILRVRVNVTAVSGGDITVTANFVGTTLIEGPYDTPSHTLPITAYDIAVASGKYTGTLEEFEADMGHSAENAAKAEEAEGRVYARNAVSSEWYRGGLSISTGKVINNDNRGRNKDFISGEDLFRYGKAVFVGADDYDYNILVYNIPDINPEGAFAGAISQEWLSGVTELTEDNSEGSLRSKDKYYRVSLRKKDNSDFVLNPDNTIQVDENCVVYNSGKREKPAYVVAQSGFYRYLTRFVVPVNLAPYGETKNVVNVKCILQLPKSYSANGEPTPLIMIGHGGTGSVSDTAWCNNNSNFRTMVDAFCGAGYAVFDVNNTLNVTDGTAVADEGCLTLMESYIAAWRYIRNHYNVTDKLYLLSNSMGTFAAMNMLKWYGSEIVTAVLSAPRISIGEIYGRAGDDDKAHIASVFSWGSVPQSYSEVESLMHGWDNYLDVHGATGDERVERSFPPVRVMVGAADSNQLTEVRTYFTALNRSGNVVQYSETEEANHSQMCYLTPEGLLDDAIEWMGRFSGLN